MVWPKTFLADEQRSLVDLLGFCILACGGIEVTEVVEESGHVWVLWSADLFANFQSFVSKWNRFGILPGLTEIIGLVA
jgi:hypothetical protein